MIDDLTSAVSLDRTTGLRSLHAAPVSTGLLMPAAPLGGKENLDLSIGAQ